MAHSSLSYEVTAGITSPAQSDAYLAGKPGVICIDTSPDQGESLPGPADLLATAFAACVLKNVQRMSILQPFEHEGATITVHAERQENPPRFTAIHYRLVIATNEAPRRVELLHRNIKKHGTVYNTLAQVCTVTGEIVAVSPSEFHAAQTTAVACQWPQT